MDPVTQAVLTAVVLTCLLAFGFSYLRTKEITSIPIKNKKVVEIASQIHKGAMVFLNREYRVMSFFMVIIGIILWFTLDHGDIMALMFVIGSIVSAAAGRLGMNIATKANATTAVESQKSLNHGLHVAFSSGLVTGLSVVGLGLLGVTAFYLWLGDPHLIFGFAFGASYSALFSRVGGGIYTKAADVGADLVGKVEKNIPEDDPRNPAVIADNVGDNVGDVAGMSADLFESYVETLVAAMVIGLTAFTMAGERAVIVPLALAGVGIISAIIGSYFVKAHSSKHLEGALNKGIYVSSGLMIIGSYFVISLLLSNVEHHMNLFWATVVGLGGGIIVGHSTEYFTSKNHPPTRSIAQAAKAGAAPNVIAGLSVGMYSTIVPILIIGFTMLFAFELGGLYGIALAAVGMLSTLGITLAADSYGPVADNAQGISEMAGLGKKVRERTEQLDAIGNTTAAIGKGFAIGSAALTSIILFIEFMRVAGLEQVGIDASDPYVLVGMLIGGLLPFVFSGLLMNAVGKAAMKIVEEVRHQFKTIKGLMKGTAKPNVERCIEISTHAALTHMVMPAIIIIAVPLLVGIILGPHALAGLLVGKTVVGFMMAIFLANAGGAWDNAKKLIEEGKFGGKGSEAHKAAVVGDTVGDPAKDTCGPAINILMKLVGVIALVFYPLFVVV